MSRSPPKSRSHQSPPSYPNPEVTNVPKSRPLSSREENHNNRYNRYNRYNCYNCHPFYHNYLTLQHGTMTIKCKRSLTLDAGQNVRCILFDLGSTLWTHTDQRM